MGWFESCCCCCFRSIGTSHPQGHCRSANTNLLRWSHCDSKTSKYWFVKKIITLIPKRHKRPDTLASVVVMVSFGRTGWRCVQLEVGRTSTLSRFPLYRTVGQWRDEVSVWSCVRRMSRCRPKTSTTMQCKVDYSEYYFIILYQFDNDGRWYTVIADWDSQSGKGVRLSEFRDGTRIIEIIRIFEFWIPDTRYSSTVIRICIYAYSIFAPFPYQVILLYTQLSASHTWDWSTIPGSTGRLRIVPWPADWKIRKIRQTANERAWVFHFRILMAKTVIRLDSSSPTGDIWESHVGYLLLYQVPVHTTWYQFIPEARVLLQCWFDRLAITKLHRDYDDSNVSHLIYWQCWWSALHASIGSLLCYR